MVNKDLCFMIMFKLIEIILIIFGKAGFKDLREGWTDAAIMLCKLNKSL